MSKGLHYLEVRKERTVLGSHEVSTADIYLLKVTHLVFHRTRLCLLGTKVEVRHHRRCAPIPFRLWYGDGVF